MEQVRLRSAARHGRGALLWSAAVGLSLHHRLTPLPLPPRCDRRHVHAVASPPSPAAAVTAAHAAPPPPPRRRRLSPPLALQENEIDVEAMRLMSAADFGEIGIPKGPAVKIAYAPPSAGAGAAVHPFLASMGLAKVSMWPLSCRELAWPRWRTCA
jgi:hypothetical protein